MVGTERRGELERDAEGFKIEMFWILNEFM